MPAKKTSPRYVAPVGGNYTDPNRAGEIRFEAGEEVPQLAAELFGWPPAPEEKTSPATAGSSQPGDDDGSAQ
jgi:hypothetical protein